jgi:hypothetical protein
MASRSHEGSSVEGYHPWTTYIYAREEARRCGDRRVGTEHLLLALLREPQLEGTPGVDLETVRAALDAMDRDALRAIGVDVGVERALQPRPQPGVHPPRPTLRVVWHDRLALTPGAKTVLKESSKEMRGFGGRHLGPQRVLEVLLQRERPDPAAELLARLGVDAATVRYRLPGA